MKDSVRIRTRLLRYLTDYENPRSVGSRFRAKRIGALKELLEATFDLYGRVDVLDVGGRRTYWNPLPSDWLRRKNVTVTLLNLPSEVKGDDSSIFRHIYGNACDLREHSDASFHIAHSNSVIEHVGDWSNMTRFATEIRRVADGIFVQTPYFWFPLEPHYLTPFFHWMPYPLRVRLMQRSSLGNRGRALDLNDAMEMMDEAPRLLDQQMLRTLFPDCKLLSERFLFLTKSLIAIRRPRGES